MKNKVIILISLLCVQIAGFAQTTTLNDNVMFSTANQDMWGAGAGFSLDKEIPLIPQTNFGNPNVSTIGGIQNVSGFGQFGMEINYGVWGSVGSKFYIKDVTGGTVDVDYPITTEIIYPSVNTINRGEWITIETDYVVNNNWKLETNFPSLGSMGLDFNFNFNLIFQPKICAFSCLPVPNINLSPAINIDIFKVSPNEIIYPGVTQSYTPSCLPPPFYCTSPLPCIVSPCLPVLIKKTLLPVTFDNGIGLTATLDLPNVNTTDNLLPNKCLVANGSYTYFTMNLDILKFMGSFIPPPTGTILSNLSNNFSAGPFTLNYNLMSASFQVTNTTYQNFTFCPTIKNNFHFATPVFYEEISPFGLVLTTGQAQDITVTAGNDLRIKYPCNYEFIDVDLDYDLENEFTNHTYDELAASFILEALGFTISMSSISIFPSGCLDPCGGLFGGCEFCWPGLTIPGFNLQPNPNPLLSFPIPIGTIPYDWVNNTWELQGFTNQLGSSFTLDAMPYLANSISTDVDCFGGNNGSIQVNVTNGVAPFNFIWSDGTTTTSLTQSSTNPNLIAGPNNVVIEDVNGCQVTTSQLITEPNQPLSIYNTVTTNVDCNGNATGSINLSVVGGTPPYTYTWTPLVSGSNVASNLPAGNYTVTITDTKLCSITENYTITEPTVLSANAIVNQNVNCNGGNDGSATIFVSGGSYPFTYAWSTGDNIQTVSNLSTGNHSCTITDVNGCTVIVPVAITEPAQPLQLVITQTPATCYNANDASINLTPTGGTAPYSFNWFNGANQMLSQHVEDPINLFADTYLTNVTDVNGCFDTISITVTQPNELLVSSFVVKNVLCNGDLTGEINLNVVGGTVPYTYVWSNGATTQDLIGVGAGIYSVTITDFNGCTYQESYTITEPALPLSASSINVDVLCFGDNSGAIDLTVDGGTLPYTYNWNSSQTSQDLNGILAGNYSVNIVDGNSCILIYNTIVNQPLAPLSVTNVVTNVTCYDSLNGNINLTVSGGTQSYFYQWSDGAEVILADTTANPQNLPADTYLVYVTDNNDCQINQNIIITQPDSIGLAYSKVDILCTNNNTGAIDLFVVGGTPNYTYTWSNASTTQDVNALLAGDYSVVVTDVNGCSNDLNVTLTEPAEAMSLVIDKKDVLCFGESTAWANATVSGGISPYTVLWSNGDTNFLADSIPAGVYTVIATDQNGCTINSGTVINEPPTPISFTNIVTDASCYNALDGIIDLTPTGGVTPYQIVYGDTLLNSFNNLDNSYQLNGLHAGVYYARIIDRNGCEYEELITVNEPDSLMVSGIVTDALCFGSADGIVDLTVTGGTLPYAFLWSDASVNQNLTGAIAGWYNVEVTDNQNCLTKATYFIGQPDDILIEGTTTDPTCRDNEDGTITIYVEGGTPGYMYLWSNNEITESIYGLASGIYVLEVTDEHACIKTDTFNINPSLIDCIEPPTAFTPDGDGINDTWILENISNYRNATVQIFNKWGNLLYETNGEYIPWNGYYQGKRLPTATYYYIINLNNGDAPYSGPITIVINE